MFKKANKNSLKYDVTKRLWKGYDIGCASDEELLPLIMLAVHDMRILFRKKGDRQQILNATLFGKFSMNIRDFVIVGINFNFLSFIDV